VAETRVVPEDLRESYDRMLPYFLSLPASMAPGSAS